MEVKPDADEQTDVQAAANPNVAISVPFENQAAALPSSYVAGLASPRKGWTYNLLFVEQS